MILPKKISGTIIAALTMIAVTSTAFADTTRNFQASLNGANEVPPASGQTTGSITLSSSGTITSGIGASMQYTLNGFGSDVTMAHLHCAPAGVSGPVVVTLFMSPQSSTTASSTSGTASSSAMTGVVANGVLSSGTISDSDIATAANCMSTIGYNIANVSDLMRAINGGQIYANIHTVQYPGGAARGQVMESTASTTSTTTTSTGDAKTNLLISLYQQLIPLLTQMVQLIMQQKGLTH